MCCITANLVSALKKKRKALLVFTKTAELKHGNSEIFATHPVANVFLGVPFSNKIFINFREGII